MRLNEIVTVLTEDQQPDPACWQRALEPITKQLRSEWEKWSWVTGGCFAFAEAFANAYGGTLYGVVEPEENDGEVDYPVHHAIVKLNGVFYDFDGRFDPSLVKPPLEIRPKSDPLVFWFEDDFLDDKQFAILKRVLKQCAQQQRPAKKTSNRRSR